VKDLGNAERPSANIRILKNLEVFQLWHVQLTNYKHTQSTYKINLFQNKNVLNISIFI
jgi:hypothetical protein